MRAMHIAFLNPQGNFDPQDRYWTAHPDFGGQLVYVKEVALALGRLGHLPCWMAIRWSVVRSLLERSSSSS